jgi:hypothetical protein
VAVASSLWPRRVARGRALQLRSILAYPESHEREGPTHRGSLALWWALARKQAELHAGAQPGHRDRCANTPQATHFF